MPDVRNRRSGTRSTPISINELKAAVEAWRTALREMKGSGVVFSVHGPPNMGVVDALVKAVEALERRISEIERRIGQQP